MLFWRPISDLTFEDIEECCRRFHENIRVEYKSTFDNSVKNKLPKVLSSFANSYGGILIIGIIAYAGGPQEPYEGVVGLSFLNENPGSPFRTYVETAFSRRYLCTQVSFPRESKAKRFWSFKSMRALELPMP